MWIARHLQTKGATIALVNDDRNNAQNYPAIQLLQNSLKGPKKTRFTSPHWHFEWILVPINSFTHGELLFLSNDVYQCYPSNHQHTQGLDQKQTKPQHRQELCLPKTYMNNALCHSPG